VLSHYVTDYTEKIVLWLVGDASPTSPMVYPRQHSCIYLGILIISYLATFLGTNSLSVLMCRKAVNQSVYLLTFALFFHSLHIVVLGLPLLLPLVALLSPIVLK